MKNINQTQSSVIGCIETCLAALTGGALEKGQGKHLILIYLNLTCV